MKDIMLKIVGRQVTNDGTGPSDEQVMEFVTEGQLFERNGSTYTKKRRCPAWRVAPRL